MDKVVQASLSLVAMQRLDYEDRVEIGIKPNARVRNDGVLELRGGSWVNEGAGYVWEGGILVDMCPHGYGGQRTASSSILSCPSSFSLKEGLSSA